MATDVSAIKEKLGLAPSTKSNIVPLKKLRKLDTARMIYYYKLDSGLLGELDEKEWMMYFDDSFYKVNRFYPRYPKDNLSFIKRKSVMQRVMSNFDAKEIKVMIDFLFEAEHDIKPKSQLNIFILSAGFLDVVSMGAQAWELGQYQTKSQMYREHRVKNSNQNTNREWDTTKHVNKPKEEFGL